MSWLAQSRRTLRSVSGLLIDTIPYLLTGVALVVASILVLHPAIPRLPPKADLWTGAGVMGVCFLCGLAAANVARHGLRHAFAPAWEGFREGLVSRATWIFLAGIFLATISIGSIYDVSLNPAWPLDGFLSTVSHNPGGVFTVVTGLATVLGFVVTIRNLHELRRGISSFQELIDRLHVMLGEAGPHNPVQMLAYTPALGALALPWPEYVSFHRCLEGARKHIHMICLTPDHLTAWHKGFINRHTRAGPVTAAMIARADWVVNRGFPIKEGEDPEWLESLRESNDTTLTGILATGTGGPAPLVEGDRIKRLPYQFMPGFYFFYSRKRAIVVAPFFLQSPLEAPAEVDAKTFETVEMLGWETSDGAIIAMLGKLWGFYQRLPSCFVADPEEVEMKVKDVKDSALLSAQLLATASQLQAPLEGGANGGNSKEWREAYVKLEDETSLKLAVRLRLPKSIRDDRPRAGVAIASVVSSPTGVAEASK